MCNYFTNKVDFNYFNDTPYILIFTEKIIESLNFFKTSLNFSSEEIFYPIKANYNLSIINLLKTNGCGFEAGALSEITLLINAGITPNQIIYGNPVKSISSIQNAYHLGIKRFCADHINEIQKLAIHAPKSEIYFRLSIDNKGAEWDLTKKFGCSYKELPELFNKAKELGLKPVGISFHVGWNNHFLKTWKSVFEKISDQVRILQKERIFFETINIGGGFPSHNVNQFDLLSKISSIILPHILNWKSQGIRVVAEPGSFLMANSGVMVVSIIDCIQRNNVNWVYVDSGIFQGFYWILKGLKYTITPLSINSKEQEKMIVCGPTCDSHDVFSYQVMLPKSIQIGDKLLIHPAGAYITSSYNYNGFYYPLEIIK